MKMLLFGIVLFSILTFFNPSIVFSILLVGQPIIKIFTDYNGAREKNLIAISVMILFVLVLKNLQTRQKYNKKLILLFVIELVFLAISLLKTHYFYPENMHNSLIKLLSYIFLLIVYVLFLERIKKEGLEKETLEYICVISFLIGFLTLIISYKVKGDLIMRVDTTTAQNYFRIGYVTFPVSIWFARRMSMGLISAYSLKNSKLILFFTVLIILSFSRGPIYSLTLTFIIHFFIRNYANKNYNIKFRHFILFLSFLVLVFVLNDTRIFSFSDGNALGRMSLIEESLQIIKRNPFGYGLDTYHLLTTSIHRYPHNLYLEIIIEFGMIYFLVHTALSLISLSILFKRSSFNNSWNQFIILIYINSFLNGFFSGNLLSNEYFLLSNMMVIMELLFSKKGVD